jgi:hypothetical protein
MVCDLCYDQNVSEIRSHERVEMRDLVAEVLAISHMELEGMLGKEIDLHDANVYAYALGLVTAYIDRDALAAVIDSRK